MNFDAFDEVVFFMGLDDFERSYGVMDSYHDVIGCFWVDILDG